MTGITTEVFSHSAVVLSKMRWKNGIDIAKGELTVISTVHAADAILCELPIPGIPIPELISIFFCVTSCIQHKHDQKAFTITT